MTDEKRRGKGAKQETSTPPAREPGREPGGSPESETRGDRHRMGETADAAGARDEGQDSGAGRDAQRKQPEETEIERAQEDETNMGHPDRPYT